MSVPRRVILGGGPAGLGAAFLLARRGYDQVTVLEQNSQVGGNAGSFELAGSRVDYGSHRLHPACDPEVLRDIRALLGPDLLTRPRHGRIRLQERWIHFPLLPLDLVFRLPRRFILGTATDVVGRVTRRKRLKFEHETFASVMEAGLGRTICNDFYFPYARKLWGLEPDQLSPVQARRRVRAGSLGGMAHKVLSAMPGFKSAGTGHFFYPRHGFGQIWEAYAQAALEAGADIKLDAHVNSVETSDDRVVLVSFEQNGKGSSLSADSVWSTIPFTHLAQALKPVPAVEALRAVESLDYRAMILIYLVLEQERFSDYDAHYFPEPNIRFSRISEPKNYGNGRVPEHLTVLCGELPCSQDSPDWCASDQDLGRLMCDSLELAGIPVRAPIRQVMTRRLRQAYPVYRREFEAAFDQLDDWIDHIDGLLTFGRQGLFAHDNTHHALYMAYSAVKCLDEDGRFDRLRWKEFRRIFETHVVED